MGLTGQIRYENLSHTRVLPDGSVDYGAAPVRLGDTVIPARAAYVIEGSHSSPSLRIEFEIRDGRPRCTNVVVTTSADGRGIRTGDLEAIPGLDRLGEDVFASLAVRVADRPADWWIKNEDARRAARRDIHTRGDAELVEVARIYRENVEGRPVSAVEEALGLSRRTASRRIEQAREKGYLPPTTQGKRKA